MLSKLVEKKGRNWDMLLGPVLMAYRTNGKTRSRCQIVSRQEQNGGDPEPTVEGVLVTDDQPEHVTWTGRSVRRPI